MAIEDLNKRHASLLQVVFLPGQENAQRFELSLDQKELAAFGYALVHWSFLENAVQEATIGIAEELQVPVPPDAHQEYQARLRLRGA
jgi:hypothetical protein